MTVTLSPFGDEGIDPISLSLSEGEGQGEGAVINVSRGRTP
jgi:hypothetical protein